MGTTSSRPSDSLQYAALFTANEQATLTSTTLKRLVTVLTEDKGATSKEDTHVERFLLGVSSLTSKSSIYEISTETFLLARKEANATPQLDASQITSNDILRVAAWLTRGDPVDNSGAWWWLIMTILHKSTTISLASFLEDIVRFVWQQQKQAIPNDNDCTILINSLLRVGFDINDAPTPHWTMAHTKDHNDDDDNDDGIDTESQLAIREAQYQDWLKKCRSSVSDNVISLEAFRSWISYSQAAQSLLKHMAEVVLLGTSNAALIAIDKHDHSSIDGTGGIPSKLLPQLTGKSGRLLASTDCWLLAQQMPVECRATWRLAFSTRYDGDNWQHLSSALLGSGSTLIVIREASSGIKDDANSTSKHLFGAFTKEAWRKSPDFYGSADNFLFTQQASSAIRTFTATSTNDHYQYLNFNTKSLPNGLGMGGQLNYFGLWIGADHFGEGHSKASPLSSTYRSPQLSSSEKFMIEEMEVWCVQERVSDEDDEQQQSSASILDRNPDATALLEMAGRTMYSKQVRDPDMDLDD